jgi:hypothetical protein
MYFLNAGLICRSRFSVFVNGSRFSVHGFRFSALVLDSGIAYWLSDVALVCVALAPSPVCP